MEPETAEVEYRAVVPASNRKTKVKKYNFFNALRDSGALKPRGDSSAAALSTSLDTLQGSRNPDSTLRAGDRSCPVRRCQRL